MEIIELEEKLRLAMLNSNVEELDKLIADTLVFTLPTGDVINKEFDLNAHRSGIQKLIMLEQSEQNIQYYDNFAVVTVKADIEGTFNDNPIGGLCTYTRVWANIGGEWQVVAGHVSEVAKK